MHDVFNGKLRTFACSTKPNVYPACVKVKYPGKIEPIVRFTPEDFTFGVPLDPILPT